MKKRFSIRKKMILIFGLLILLAGSVEGIMAVNTARRAVGEKIEKHLTDKAADVASIIDGKITAFLQFIIDIAHMPQVRDTESSIAEKLRFLKKEAELDSKIWDFDLCDLKGKRYTYGGTVVSIGDRDWYQAAVNGKPFVSEPIISRLSGKFVIACAVPVYDDNKNIIHVLLAVIDGTRLCEDISDIVVGESGECFILGLGGVMIANKDKKRVTGMENLIKEADEDSTRTPVAEFLKQALETAESTVGYYTYKGVSYIASYATMKVSGWKVIIKAPIDEFMGTVQKLRFEMILIGLIILALALITVYFVARAIVKPIHTVVSALQNIAQGEGDLTVRLPLSGNDEITDLSSFFNQTIEKIGTSIKSVGTNSAVMQQIGNELAINMSETAGAVRQISANIDGVKQQALTQASSVTEMAATVEQIIRTIKQLNAGIENEAASVAESSSAVEQMVANIASITETLEKTDGVIKTLATATADGKDTVVNANTVTQKIAEESGSLMEASSVIQHIASQTNLLAMNAAIEAAHAGEAGKGFAVVADEIRKLAEESSAQGKTITTTLKTLGNEIETLSNAARTAEEKFGTIFNLSEQVKTMSNRLTEAMREQENGSKEVLLAIRDINTVTTQVSDGAAEMLRGGEIVSIEMHKLDDLTRLITDSMNEMASGAEQINKAVQQVHDITQKNKQSIENMTSEVNKFKV